MNQQTLVAVASGMMVDIPIHTVRQALSMAELGGSSSVRLEIGLDQVERLASSLKSIVSSL